VCVCDLQYMEGKDLADAFVTAMVATTHGCVGGWVGGCVCLCACVCVCVWVCDLQYMGGEVVGDVTPLSRRW